jgi:hypothetical protein
VHDRDDRFWHVPSAELEVGLPRRRGTVPIATSGAALAGLRAGDKPRPPGSMMTVQTSRSFDWRE